MNPWGKTASQGVSTKWRYTADEKYSVHDDPEDVFTAVGTG